MLRYRNRANIDKESFQTGYVNNNQRSLSQERSFQNVFCIGRRYAENMPNRERCQDPTVFTNVPKSSRVSNKLPTPSRELMPISEPTRRRPLFRSIKALAFASGVNGESDVEQFRR